MPDDEMAPGGARRIDHRAALRQRERHRLFHQGVLAGGEGEAGVPGMELVRRRDVNGLHRGLGAQLLHACVGAAAEVALELRARFGTWIGGGDELDALVGRERRRHQRERTTEPCNAEADCRHGWRGVIIGKYLGTFYEG